MDIRQPVQKVKGVGPQKAKTLAKMGILTVYDLLTWFPRTYEDQSVLTPISALRAGETATFAGRIVNVRESCTARRRLTVLTAFVEDDTGIVQVTWFNQKFLKKQLQPGSRLFVSGKATYAYGGRGQMVIASPSFFEILKPGEEADSACGIEPVYSVSGKLTQKIFRTLQKNLWAAAPEIDDLIPEHVREDRGLMSRREAFYAMHFPADWDELKRARHTLAFEELYLIQCGLLALKQKAQAGHRGVRHLQNSTLVGNVTAALPFTLTHDQQQVWREICRDMERDVPMRRLVQGDVGSGKTVIAMLALVKTVENGCQGALMAPTEILAHQHYESLQKQLAPFGIRVAFLSGHLGKKAKEEIYAKLAAQEIDIIVGTHALIQDPVTFHRLGLVVTDEQHRFGIEQRAALEKKGTCLPDVLVMTATPIPRTMTLTVYGDLDVSRIEELPPGRQPVRTFVRQKERRTLIYEYVRQQIEAGRQAYVVCPRIEHSDEENNDVPSVEDVYDELANGIFFGLPCAMLHGKMSAQEKETVMQAFYENRISLLVTTTVIEVGVNVPNASMMVVENADRFGLAQLHQLRGRIGRGPYKSYCILVSDCHTENARERMTIMAQTSDGFKLAEEDLRLRGPGQFFGDMQHGLPDLKVASVWEDMDILTEARQAALGTLTRQKDLDAVLQTLSLQYREQFLHITET